MSCHGRGAKRRVYDKLHIVKAHECVYHATQQGLKVFETFSREFIQPFVNFALYWCHRIVHDDIQVIIMRFDRGRFQMNTCRYGT